MLVVCKFLLSGLHVDPSTKSTCTTNGTCQWKQRGVWWNHGFWRPRAVRRPSRPAIQFPSQAMCRV